MIWSVYIGEVYFNFCIQSLGLSGPFDTNSMPKSIPTLYLLRIPMYHEIAAKSVSLLLLSVYDFDDCSFLVGLVVFQ